MNAFHVLFLLVLIPVGFTHGQNKRDDQGKKHGAWVIKGKDRPGAGYAKDAVVEKGSYSHGRKTGVWVKFFKDGQHVKLKGNYVNNRPNGNYTRYYPNGKIKEVGTFGNKKQTGSLIRYYKNGQISYKATFTADGKESGGVKHFYENGKLQAEYTIVSGKVNGTYKQYNENGTLKAALKFNNGRMTETVKANKPGGNDDYSNPDSKEPPPFVKSPITKGVKFFPDGYNKVYNANDEIWLDGNFKNGQLFDGKVYIYSSNGILKRIRIYKEGKFHSLGQN